VRLGRGTIQNAISPRLALALGFALAFGFALALATLGAASCATAEGSAAATTSDPRHDAADVSRARRVSDWKRLSAALAGLPCKAIGVTGEGERTSIVIPADCLFAAEGSALSEAAAPVVTAIARELRQEAERDFWITATPGPPAPNAARLTNARAAAVVAALITAGMPPAHVAAILGLAEREAEPPGPATVEIIVAPDRDELGSPRH
jgi:flagellar motor protein MotB